MKQQTKVRVYKAAIVATIALFFWTCGAATVGDMALYGAPKLTKSIVEFLQAASNVLLVALVIMPAVAPRGFFTDDEPAEEAKPRRRRAERHEEAPAAKYDPRQLHLISYRPRR